MANFKGIWRGTKNFVKLAGRFMNRAIKSVNVKRLEESAARRKNELTKNKHLTYTKDTTVTPAKESWTVNTKTTKGKDVSPKKQQKRQQKVDEKVKKIQEIEEKGKTATRNRNKTRAVTDAEKSNYRDSAVQAKVAKRNAAADKVGNVLYKTGRFTKKASPYVGVAAASGFGLQPLNNALGDYESRKANKEYNDNMKDRYYGNESVESTSPTPENNSNQEQEDITQSDSTQKQSAPVSNQQGETNSASNETNSEESVETPESTQDSNSTYKVESGDTLSKIAAENNTTVENLMALNSDIKNPDLIYEGQNIKLTGTPSEEEKIDAQSRISSRKKARKARKKAAAEEAAENTSTKNTEQSNAEEDLNTTLDRKYPYEYRKKQADAFVQDYVNRLRNGADPYSQEEFDKNWGKWLIDNYKPLNN